MEKKIKNNMGKPILSSRVNPSELYDLASESIRYNGNEDVYFITPTDFFEWDKDGGITLTKLKELDGMAHVVSKEKIEVHSLYLIQLLLENAADHYWGSE